MRKNPERIQNLNKLADALAEEPPMRPGETPLEFGTRLHKRAEAQTIKSGLRQPKGPEELPDLDNWLWEEGIEP